MASMTVEVVSPERVLFSGEATMVITRTQGGGEIAFLPGHAPFLGALSENHTRVFLVDGSTLDIAVHAGFVEVSNSKVSILSDVAELGPGVFGIERAAQYWFGKPAADLDVRETAFLVALTPAPRTISRRVAAYRLASGGGPDDPDIDPETAYRIDVVLGAMKRAGAITDRQHRAAREARLTLRRDALAALGQ